MAVVRTSKIDLHVNGNGAYAFVAQPDDDAKHPGVVLIQEWWGIEPHILDLANKLATEGFVVAVPDLYHGKVATEPNDAMRMIMMIRSNVDRAAQEVIGALNTVKAMPNVEPKKLGLIGFCVGGFMTYTVASRYPDIVAAAVEGDDCREIPPLKRLPKSTLRCSPSMAALTAAFRWSRSRKSNAS